MSRSEITQKQSEKFNKDIDERILSTEKSFDQLHKLLSVYLQRTSEQADTGGQLRNTLLDYSVSEKLNPTLSEGLKQFIDHYGTVELYRDALARRLEAKVVNPLQEYGQLCKRAKADVRKSQAALAKERKTNAQLGKDIRKRPSDQGRLAARENDRQKAGVQASKSAKDLEDSIREFEHRKIFDLKRILQSFVHSEMLFHARALETFTKCHNSLRAVDPEADLESFMQSLLPNTISTRQQIARSTSASTLNSVPERQMSHRASPQSARVARKSSPGAKATAPHPRRNVQEPEEESDGDYETDEDGSEYTDDDEYTYATETTTRR